MPRRPRPLVLPLVLLAALALSGTGPAPAATAVTGAVTAPAPGTYVPITPVRALDTRVAVGIPTRTPVPGGGIVPVDTTRVAGLPATGVGAVVVTLTVTAPQAAGYLTAWADDEDMPATSSLNWAPQQTVANTAVVRVGQDGRLLLESGSAAPAHLVVDVEGYVAAGKPATAGAYTPMSPQRVLDTRKAVGIATTTPLPPTSSTRLTLGGHGGPAAGAGAVVLNLTATAGTQTGYVALGGKPVPPSGGSVLTWRPGQTVASLVVAPLAPDGSVTLYVASVGSVHLVADLVGVLTPGAGTDPGTTTVALPYRQLDTRAPGATFGALAPRTSRPVSMAAGPLAVAPGTVSAVLVTVTVTNTRAGGYLTGYASGGRVPTASLVNWATGQTVSATVLLPVGPDGRIALWNGSVGAADVVVDLSGTVAAAVG
ncbi:hypothetical protein [Lapillicoccus jejuensis]|uniref:Uncharacterized protein n=1 Tax=Lapillicoccus jejuensis TaxID=402171 RepID=A0A542DZC0_9MICO|nr:hypothetical protein [Lapillicoccus jejuensis]TQJ08399.1 hypothetical protein FB458_1487 [Lapillicoccus jejuensis]